MHPLDQRFAIMTVCGARISFLKEDGTLAATSDKGKTFTSFTEAREHMTRHLIDRTIYGAEADTYSVIPLVDHVVAPKEPELPSLPPPDFYEVGEPTSALSIITALSDHNFNEAFTPVDNITGAGQMQAGVSTDPHDDRAVARSAKFSFPGWMEQDEIVKLRESAIRPDLWKNLRIVNRGNGFSKWFIVILSQDLK